MTSPDKFAFDFPSFQLEYGINERWSVGLNGLASLGTINFKNTPTIGIKARHSIYSDQAWRVTLSGYFFQLPITPEQVALTEGISGVSRLTMTNLNVSKAYETNELGLSSTYSLLMSSLKANDRPFSSKSTFHSITSAFWWRWNANRDLGTELLGLLIPATKVTQDTVQIESKQTEFSIFNSATMRALVNWRPSERWLWCAGALMLPELPAKVLPYLGFTLQFPSYEQNTAEEQIQ
jgi:hypothetical protein